MFEQVTGLRRQDIVGRSVEEAYAVAEPVQEQLQIYARVVGSGQPERFELHFPPLDKYFMISAFPLGGRRFATVSTDITDRKKAEEILQRYQLLSRHARDIILFIRLNGQIIEANDAAEKVYGYTREELLSLKIYDLRAPETILATAEQMHAASDGGILFETIHRRKDGSLFPVEASSQGTMIGGEKVLLSIIRDITDRKQAEHLIDLERRRLQAVMDALPIGVYIADADGRITEVNEIGVKIWGGLPPMQSISDYELFRGWRADTGERISSDEWSMVRALISGETSMGEVIDIERFDGTRGTIINNAAPILDQEGKTTGAVVAAEDITELHRLRQELERSLREEKEESHRVAALESVAEAGITTLELQDLLDTLAERIRMSLNSHSCSMLILDEVSGDFVLRAAHGESLEPGVRFKPDEGFVGKISTLRKSVYVEDARADPLIVNPHLKKIQARSLLGTPLIAHDKVVGVVYIDMMQVHHFANEDIRLFEAMAIRAASAIENAQLHEQLACSREQLQHNLTQLQQALVPVAPVMEHPYDVASIYIPSMAAGQEIGGDFYDVFRTRDGRYGILIGDVSGKGIPAASLAASTRSIVHALAYESSCASDALTRANAILCSQNEAFGPFVTVFLAVLDPEIGEFCYSSAGHPPAVICYEDGSVEFLKSGQAPVGLICSQEYTENICRLESGDKLIAYTDGITEAKHGSDLFELEGVKKIIEENAGLYAGELMEHILDAAKDWAEGKLTDDAAIVVVQRGYDRGSA